MLKKFVLFLKVAAVLLVLFLIIPNDIETIEGNNTLVHVYKTPAYSVWAWRLYAPYYSDGYKLDLDLHWFFDDADHYKEKFQTYQLTVSRDYYNGKTSFYYNPIYCQDDQGVRYLVRGRTATPLCALSGNTVEVTAIKRFKIDPRLHFSNFEPEYTLLAVEIKDLGDHRWSEWKVTKEHTCTQTGEKERVCRCGAKETVEIETRPHYLQWRENPDKLPEEKGMYAQVCEHCKQIFGEKITTSEGSRGLSYQPDFNTNTCTVTGIGSCRDTILRIPEYFGTCRVTAIGNQAFREQKHITEVYLPASIRVIGDEAFRFCDSLRSVYVSSQLEFVGDYAFSNSKRLSHIELPNSVSYIGTHAFMCTNLQYFKWPANTHTLKYCTFVECTNLKSFYIPNSVWAIESIPLQYTSIDTLHIPDSVVKIDSGLFQCMQELTQITLPETITEIPKYTFAHCYKLPQLTLPKSVTQIEEFAFWNCTSLASITIHDNVSHIEDNAFSGCERLKMIRFKGCKEQWNNIVKGELWNNASAISVIRCTDGDIIL